MRSFHYVCFECATLDVIDNKDIYVITLRDIGDLGRGGSLGVDVADISRK